MATESGIHTASIGVKGKKQVMVVFGDKITFSTSNGVEIAEVKEIDGILFFDDLVSAVEFADNNRNTLGAYVIPNVFQGGIRYYNSAIEKFIEKIEY